MKKKSILIAACLSAVMCVAPVFAGCGDEKPKHEHTLFTTEAVAATCVAEGNVEYQECIYCNDIFIGGVEKELADTVLAIDPNNHTHLTEHELEPAKCFTDGVKAHSVCDGCGKIFADGAETQEEDLAIAQTGAHTWDGTECSLCDAYKMSIDSSEIIIDEHTRYEIKAAGSNAFASQGATVNPFLVENPGTWACQTGSGVTASITDSVLKVNISSNAARKKCQSFMRFIPSRDGETAYIGKYLLVFDLKVTKKNGSVAKPKLTIGYFIQSSVDSGNMATITDSDQEFEIGATYRFAVLVETTLNHQFVQFNMRNTENSGADLEIFNTNVVYLEGTPVDESLESKMFMQLIEAV